jgi:transcriptional regulator with XRE-family HTH domain
MVDVLWYHHGGITMNKYMPKQNHSLSKNLKRLREEKGLSQDRLAKLANIANNTIIKIEQGGNINPRLDTLKKIAKALGTSVDDLINDS